MPTDITRPSTCLLIVGDAWRPVHPYRSADHFYPELNRAAIHLYHVNGLWVSTRAPEVLDPAPFRCSIPGLTRILRCIIPYHDYAASFYLCSICLAATSELINACRVPSPSFAKRMHELTTAFPVKTYHGENIRGRRLASFNAAPPLVVYFEPTVDEYKRLNVSVADTARSPAILETYMNYSVYNYQSAMADMVISPDLPIAKSSALIVRLSPLQGEQTGSWTDYDIHFAKTCWDRCIIEQGLGADPYWLARDLLGQVTDKDRTTWLASTPVDWANEAFAISVSPEVGNCVRTDTGCWYN